MCFSNAENPSYDDLVMELKRLRWEAEIREQELDRLYKQEDHLRRILYKTTQENG